MKITIDKQYLLHQGGTKFYQVLRVQATEGSGAVTRFATVTHWGKQIGEAGPRRVVASGEFDLHGGDLYTKKIREKRARGYQDKIEWGNTNVLKNFDALRTYLNEELGAVKAAELIAKLGFEPGVAFDPDATPDTSPAFAAASAARVAEVPMASRDMEGWGEF